MLLSSVLELLGHLLLLLFKGWLAPIFTSAGLNGEVMFIHKNKQGRLDSGQQDKWISSKLHWPWTC